MKRETGYYWVKMENHYEIAFYNSDQNIWFIWGSEKEFKDWYFNDIDEHKIERNDERK